MDYQELWPVEAAAWQAEFRWQLLYEKGDVDTPWNELDQNAKFCLMEEAGRKIAQAYGMD